MRPVLCICLLIAVALMSGCWDRTEINDIAFITGSAIDRTDNGEYLLSVQIAIPSSGQSMPGGGGNGRPEKFFVLSAVGMNLNEAFANIQKQSSRRLFTAHRSVVFISEACGRHGVNDILDVFNHDPRQRLKTYIMIVKGGSGREILQMSYPFDQVPMEAVKEMEGMGSELAVTLRDFFIASSSQGISPVMGVIEGEENLNGQQDQKKIFKLAGTAIFKHLQLVGLLDGTETSGLLWATGKMKNGRINAPLPDGKGSVGMLLNHANRIMISEINGDRFKVKLQLQGDGSLVENNSKLDISRPNNLELVQEVLEKMVENQVRDVISKLQKKYKADSIGFGRDIYRNHPKQWKALQGQWEDKFPEAEVAVDVKLSIKGAGTAGPPLQLKETEIIK